MEACCSFTFCFETPSVTEARLTDQQASGAFPASPSAGIRGVCWCAWVLGSSCAITIPPVHHRTCFCFPFFWVLRIQTKVLGLW